MNQAPSRVAVYPSRAEEFLELLSRYQRIVLVGPPKSGKTTLAKLVTDRPVIKTDDMGEFNGAADRTVEAAEKAGDTWLVEGVIGYRALRKGLKADLVIELPLGRHLTPGQRRMFQGMHSQRYRWLDLCRENRPVIMQLGGWK